MKYPVVLAISDVLLQLERFDAIIDVRSPHEFAEDHLPGAINCPVLDDAQRVQVGTMYKNLSTFEAKKLGAALVAKNIAWHIEHTFMQHPQSWKPLVYCWRGGNRSGAMALILSKIGWPAAQLDGGYKTFRAQVNTELATLPQRFRYNVLCGPTGSGKSRLLQTLAAQGAQVLDLEHLARHRGSVLGNLPAGPQPSQKHFESLIWDLLRSFDPAHPVFIESESKKVGKLRVPEALIVAMRSASCTAVNLALAQRVQLLMQDYLHFVNDPALLAAPLDLLAHLHGREKISHWQQLAQTGQMEKLVEELLTEHYDPAYLHSIQRNFDRLGQARPLALADISEQSFAQAAAQLCQLAASALPA